MSQVAPMKTFQLPVIQILKFMLITLICHGLLDLVCFTRELSRIVNEICCIMKNVFDIAVFGNFKCFTLMLR